MTEGDDTNVVRLDPPEPTTLVDAIALECARRVEAIFLEQHGSRALRLAKVQAEISSALQRVAGQLM
jgi:hypothetical protein